jgi:hypothetical protein
MIDETKYYSLAQIIENKYIPWIGSIPTLRKWVKRDEQLFKTISKGVGFGRRYFIKGSALVEVLKLAEEGKLKYDNKEHRVKIERFDQFTRGVSETDRFPNYLDEPTC